MDKILSKIISACAAASFSASAFASPIIISASLTGDPRLPAQYQNLLINVSIVGDTTSNVVNWTVDIASPLQTTARLDEFYFNMSGDASDYSFSNFSPVVWTIESPATNAAGSGGATFLFQALNPPPGNPNVGSVTNDQNLTFQMAKSEGNFTAMDFLAASPSCSNDELLGCGQLGAHLISLNEGRSGFLFGNFVDDTTRPPQEEVPEPASLALMGLGMLALVAARRRRS